MISRRLNRLDAVRSNFQPISNYVQYLSWNNCGYQQPLRLITGIIIS